ncbi:MAG: hypothetical protein IPG99_15455 [Ignavibacteria bacterium]|nr:hypothetical protein [Ignavibacteria bacterium]
MKKTGAIFQSTSQVNSTSEKILVCLIHSRNYNYIITNKNILNAGQILRECEEFLDLYAEEEFEEISLNLEMMFLKMNLGKITEKEFLQFRELVFKISMICKLISQ